MGSMVTTLTVRWLAPIAAAGLVMLPRLAPPPFGLLGDGVTLQAGREGIRRGGAHPSPHSGARSFLPGLLARLLRGLRARRRPPARVLHGQRSAPRRPARDARPAGALGRRDPQTSPGWRDPVRAVRADDRNLLHPVEGRAVAADVDRPLPPGHRGGPHRSAPAGPA